MNVSYKYQFVYTNTKGSEFLPDGKQGFSQLPLGLGYSGKLICEPGQ
jgi:hypothetical protein